MIRIIAAALALAVATPALANGQLAQSLGVEPGAYTLAQLAALKNAATQDGNEGNINLTNIGNTGRPISE